MNPRGPFRQPPERTSDMERKAPRKPAQQPQAAQQNRRGKSDSAGSKGSPRLYGLHAAAAAWLNPERECLRLSISESGFEAMESTLDAAKKKGLRRPQPELRERADLDRMVPAGSVHQGIVLEVKPLEELGLEDILVIADSLEGPACVVVLDQVTDPHNVGAILRSASAFGALAVLVTERHAPEVTGVLAKSASGALEVTPIARVGNLARALDDLRNAGFWTVGLAEEGAQTLAQLDLNGRVALVMGAEGPGLRRLTRERCDVLARLPTQGAIGSLNVSNAAAVALYEVARRR
jgi:23S rRNA (guanosine2251-2'-O)-methyltransferase